MATPSLRSPLTLSILALFLGILGSLHLMSSATQDASQLGRMYSTLILTNILAGLLLLSLVGFNIYWLFRELRRKAAGSNLTSRMIFLFSLLTLAPASIVFYYSMQFLDRSIDSWFDVKIDQAMEDALELGQTALDERMRNLVKETEQTAANLSSSPASLLGVRLSELSENKEGEFILFTRQGQVIAFSGANTDAVIPNLPEVNIMIQVRHGKSYVGLEQNGSKGLQIRAVVPLIGEDSIFLQGVYTLPQRLAQLSETVEFAYLHYKEMTFLRSSLKFTFTLTLSLILLLSLLAAVWSAFLSIRRIVEPVRLLAIGTRAIAEGDYEKRLPVKDRGELGFLVESFNAMTDKIAQARDEAHRSQQELRSQHEYLETVLANLSSAVLSLDSAQIVMTANQAANDILHADFEQYLGWPLDVLSGAYPHIAELVTEIRPKLESEKSSWRQEISLNGPQGRQELFCRGTTLLDSVGEKPVGTVIVIDDVTALIQAQRNSAWSEVARRLAHEIKNPLTPIQLSAERLRHKLSKVLTDVDLEVLEKSTRTIIQQVEAMKSMVNAFSEYAKPTITQVTAIDLQPLLEEIVALYPPSSGIHFEMALAEGGAWVMADPVKLRQVIHNLIKNAQEAMPQGHEGKIQFSTRSLNGNREHMELRVTDDGPGIPQEQAARIFEPYVTNKTKGTGLGLAIVKRIIEELGGEIKLDTTYLHGASFIILLPTANP